jgi:hypothetical protein
MTHPHWALDVGLLGRPLSFGNIEAYEGRPMSMKGYKDFLGANFDPTIGWHDLEWIRESWKGKLVIKGCSTRRMRAMRSALAPMALSSRTMAGVSLTGDPHGARPAAHCRCGGGRSDGSGRFRGAVGA